MAVRTHVRASKGFSLIELMIAVVFIMISMLALLTAIVTSMRTNLENDLRNTAIRLTNQTAEALLALSIDPTIDPELTDGSHSRIAGNTTQNEKGFPLMTQTVRGSQQLYTIDWAVVSRTTSVKEITITVSYTSRNKPYTNTAVIYKHKVI
jgi:Tfp pilus assembly protein PilV